MTTNKKKGKGHKEKGKKKGQPHHDTPAKRYDFRDNATGAILAIVNEKPTRQLHASQFHRKFGAKDLFAKAAVEALLEQMALQGQIAKVGPLTFQAVGMAEPAYLLGRVDYVNPEYLYVIPEPGTAGGPPRDIWVHRRHAGNALDGDTVKVLVHQFRKDSRPEGEIVEVVARARTEFVGTIEIGTRYAFVIPDKRKMYHDIFINLRHLNEAKHGQKVVAAITEWEGGDKSPIGRVVKVLGKSGDHETEMHSIMAEYGLPYEFPDAVLHEARQISEVLGPELMAQRRDLRGVPTFTIDPEDAQDFDDALSLRRLENGHWEVGVHIADVTHYVRPGTLLEQEALRRATSVYLVDRCIPMLPEKLSNRLCSLRPHEDKLTFSAVFELDDRGKLVEEWFGRTVIHSDRRFTYEEAQEVLATGQGDYAAELTWLNQTAKALQKARVKKGAILFETTELKFKLDENKKPIAIVPKVRQDAHKLIEEFMLLANRRVAEHVYHLRKGKRKNTMVYRIHDAPDPEKIQNFANFAKQFGYNLKVDEKAVSSSLNELAIQSEGKPEQGVLQQLAIRAMAKARYTTDPTGHFGLAFDHYSHFTSPIRRYPDMMAHRLLQHYLDGGEPLDPAPLEESCKHSSEMEKRAAEAERASIKYKQVELMQDLKLSGALKNRALPGVVTGVTEWGIYVEATETRCEGMVRLADLQGDHYEFDEKKYAVVGRRYGRIFRFGDAVRVRIKATNLEKRTIDFFMDEE
jgi:ribonuclease R